MILDDLAVHAEVMSQSDAVKSGAMALFGEKYGDEVRVVSVGDWARELCGGTHAGSSGKLGVIKLLGESSIGSGVRRVEALVGSDAYQFLAREHVLVAQLSEALKVRPEQLPERVNDIVERLRTAEKEIDKVRLQQLLAAGGDLAASAEDVSGVALRRPRGRPAPGVATCAPWCSTSATGSRRTGRAWSRSSAPPMARPRSSSPSTTMPAPSGSPRTPWCGWRPRCSAARAAARTTWPRAAARRSRSGEALAAIRQAVATDGQVASPDGRQLSGVRLGVDPGDARIGVASSDPSGILATPVETVARGAGDLDRLAALVEELGAVGSMSAFPARCPGEKALGR